MKGKLGRKLMAISAMLTAATASPDFAARDLFQHARAGGMAVGETRPRSAYYLPRRGRQSPPQPRQRRPVQQQRFQEEGGFPGNFPGAENHGYEQQRPIYQYKKPQDGAVYNEDGNRVRRRGYNQRPKQQQRQPQPEYRQPQSPPKRVFVDLEREAIIEDEEPEIELVELIEPAPSNEKLYVPASGPAYKPEAQPRSDFGDYADGVVPMPDFGAPYVLAEDRSGGPDSQHDIQSAVFAAANAYKPDGVYQTEDRLDFQIHGHEGPHSYRYGYDTGHGYNRQFRYEERDGHGHVKGRYGFFDKHGKLQVTNYSADPYKGFHAEGENIPKYPH